MLIDSDIPSLLSEGIQFRRDCFGNVDSLRSIRRYGMA